MDPPQPRSHFWKRGFFLWRLLASEDVAAAEGADFSRHEKTRAASLTALPKGPGSPTSVLGLVGVEIGVERAARNDMNCFPLAWHLV